MTQRPPRQPGYSAGARMIWLFVFACIALRADARAASAPSAPFQPADSSVSGGWVAAPAAGATSTAACVVVNNPTMYDFYIVKASSDAAESVELRQAGKDAPLVHVVVPAYGSLEMRPAGVHLVLKNLKKPLAVGDKITLALVTEAGAQMSTEATIKAQ